MSKTNYSGTFHMVEQENMDSYLAALGKTVSLHRCSPLYKRMFLQNFHARAVLPLYFNRALLLGCGEIIPFMNL